MLIVLADEEAEEAEQSSLDATIKEDEAALEAEPGHQVQSDSVTVTDKAENVKQ